MEIEELTIGDSVNERSKSEVREIDVRRGMQMYKLYV